MCHNINIVRILKNYTIHSCSTSPGGAASAVFGLACQLHCRSEGRSEPVCILIDSRCTLYIILNHLYMWIECYKLSPLMLN